MGDRREGLPSWASAVTAAVAVVAAASWLDCLEINPGGPFISPSSHSHIYILGAGLCLLQQRLLGWGGGAPFCSFHMPPAPQIHCLVWCCIAWLLWLCRDYNQQLELEPCLP